MFIIVSALWEGTLAINPLLCPAGWTAVDHLAGAHGGNGHFCTRHVVVRWTMTLLCDVIDDALRGVVTTHVLIRLTVADLIGVLNAKGGESIRVIIGVKDGTIIVKPLLYRLSVFVAAKLQRGLVCDLCVSHPGFIWLSDLAFTPWIIVAAEVGQVKRHL